MADLLQAYRDACAQRAQQDRLRRLPGRNAGLRADFSHNDYLGLSQHPQVIHAAQEAAARWGAGATGSRLLSGDYDFLAEFEHEIAHSKGSETALIYVSGYQANATALSALLDAKILGAAPQVFADRLNHASLHHACQLAGVRQQRYRHCDLDHLETLLQQSNTSAPKFIVSETVFGMDGDRVDVSALAALAQRYDALLYLDDAHATGIFGPQGYGLGNAHPNTVVMGTFSKAIGASGAYLACSQIIADYLVNHSTGFIYSTAPAPAAIGAARAAWQLLPTLDETRAQLLHHADQVRARLQAQGYDTGASDTHILPVILGDDAKTLALRDALLARGIKVSAIRPPTVPPNGARLRIALAASHTHEQIEALLEGFGA